MRLIFVGWLIWLGTTSLQAQDLGVTFSTGVTVRGGVTFAVGHPPNVSTTLNLAFADSVSTSFTNQTTITVALNVHESDTIAVNPQPTSVVLNLTEADNVQASKSGSSNLAFNLALTETDSVLAGSGLGGPPNYSKAITSNSQVIQNFSPTPNFGGTTGTNICKTPGDFNETICRVTDSVTGSSNFTVTPSGSDSDNIWNTDSTFLLVTASGSGTYRVIGFNPNTLTASTSVVPGFTQGGALSWSHTNNKVLYQVTGAAIVRWTFTNGTTAPTATTIYNWATSCPGFAPYSVSWVGALRTDGTDSQIQIAMSNSGGQETGHRIAAYNFALNKCSYYDTSTGVVAGDWGSTGTATDTASYRIHDSYLGPGGVTAITMSVGSCVSGDCLSTTQNQYFWTAGTTTVQHAPNAAGATGHSVPGYNSFINYNPGYPQMTITNFSSLGHAQWPGPYPGTCCAGTGGHLSWNNDNPSDTAAIFESGSTPGSNPASFSTPFQNEIFAQMPNGTFRRFAHNFVTGTNANFYDAQGIGAVSQDGKFFAFTSDMLGGIGGRIDVFVVQLQ